MPDPNLPMLKDAARKLAPFLDEIVFVGGVTLGLLISAAADCRIWPAARLSTRRSPRGAAGSFSISHPSSTSGCGKVDRAMD